MRLNDQALINHVVSAINDHTRLRRRVRHMHTQAANRIRFELKGERKLNKQDQEMREYGKCTERCQQVKTTNGKGKRWLPGNTSETRYSFRKIA